MNFMSTGTIANFPQKAFFNYRGSYLRPHMGQGPQTSPKRYISNLFEKLLHNIVTYLEKIFGKSRFPEGRAQ